MRGPKIIRNSKKFMEASVVVLYFALPMTILGTDPIREGIDPKFATIASAIR